jgi:hypothetical protein
VAARAPQVASKLFAQRHRQLSAELAALRVRLVQVRDNRGWVVLDLGPARERVVYVHREHGAWKMDELLKDEAL